MTDNIDDDTLIDKADALMRRRGFNTNPEMMEATEALSLTEDIETSETSEIAHSTEINQSPPQPAHDAVLEKTSGQSDDTHASLAQSDTMAPDASLNAPIVEQDIPTLTDVVQENPHTPQHPTSPPIHSAQTQADFQKTLDALLEEALPEIIATTLDKLKDPLTRELRNHLRTELLSQITTHPETER